VIDGILKVVLILREEKKKGKGEEVSKQAFNKSS
jgi:hypothetical protein